MAKYEWVQSEFKGVRYREHPTRKVAVGAAQHSDKYFAIRYQNAGERIEEGLGWSSSPEKWTAKKAFIKLSELKEAAKNSLDAPVRLSEERERNAEIKRLGEVERQNRAEEKKRNDLENVTVEKYFTDSYLPTIKTHRKRPDQIHDDSHFKLWICPVVGSKHLKDVSSFDLERIKKNMLAESKAPRTIQYVMATFRQIWNMAKRDKIVSGDSPTRGVKLQKVDNQRKRYLTKQEVDLLLTELKKTDVNAYRMATLSIYTGLRAEEIFHLTWRDVDTDKGHISISDPKNSESRYAYITEPVKAVIDEMIEGKPEESLFIQKKGFPYQEAPKSFRVAVETLKFNAGVEDKRLRVCFHTLRHTFGSWLAESGVDLYTIGKLMGHKTTSMTARYAHLGETTMRAAAKQLENIKSEYQPAQEEQNANVA